MTTGGVAGACVIRDAVDLVPFLCGHYLRAGFEFLAFVDDGSSDGTFELLKKIAKRTSRVSVRQVHNDTYEQSALMTETVNALISAGASIVIPFDSDEFWNADAAEFKRLSASVPEAIFHGRWVNFIQSRQCLLPSARGLLNMRLRASLEASANRETIAGYTHSFACYSESKIGLKTGSAVKIGRGQHGLTQGPDRVCGPVIEIFHLPLRSRQEIIKRGLNYEPRRAPLRQDVITSWQSRFHRDVVMDDKIDVVWAANSFNESGCLNVYGTPLGLIADNRLRRLLVMAALHLFVRYGLNSF